MTDTSTDREIESPKTRLRQLSAAAGMGLLTLLGLLLLLGAHPRPVMADPVYLFVKPHATGDCTMGNPCSLQAALDAAVDGDIIYMAGGIYTSTNTGPSTAIAVITKSISLLGGWNGLLTKLPIRNPDTWITTLDGEDQRRGIYLKGSSSAPITPRVEGVRVTRGNGGSFGGGIYVRYAAATVEDCHVFENTVSTTGGGILVMDGDGSVLAENQIYTNTSSWHGGGIHIASSDSVAVMSSTIRGNTADEGGGIYVDSTPGTVLAGNTLYTNTATTGNGGGIVLYGSSGSALTGNTLLDNLALMGGGIYVQGSHDVTMASNTIQQNRATGGPGGGLYVNSCTGFTLVNAFVVDNQCFSQGAGIRVNASTAHLLHTTVARNTGDSGIHIGNSSTAWLTNTILVSHTIGIETDAASAATLNDTLWGAGAWANGTDTQGPSITTSADVWGDPQFVNPGGGNYRILGASAAVNAGLPAFAVQDDVDGNPRPDCVAWDLGAYEYSRTVCYHICLPLTLRDD